MAEGDCIMRRIEVVWKDASSRPNWQEPDEMRNAGLVTCRTLGYLVHSDDTALIIAHSLTEDGNGDTTTIPIGSVEKIRELKPARRIDTI